MNRGAWIGLAGLAAIAACSGEPVATEQPAPPPKPAEPVQKGPPPGPLATLIMVQSQFIGSAPGPAKMTLYRTDGKEWYPEVVEDPDSNVFHKAMAWRDGILTLGANGTDAPPIEAHLKHWKRDGDGWKATTLFAGAFGGKFNRLRDIEVADLDGDGAEEIALATHDMGVVIVGDEVDGAWTFQEMDKTPDIFVHEVEIGDVDGDGKPEFYVTPSERNKASGVSQPGGVARYDFQGDKYVRSQIVHWDESHAKEILVADLDGDGTDELYVAKEGHVIKEGKKKVLKDPAQIVRMVPAVGKWEEKVVATLADEKQCRFLVAADVDHDGKKDMVAAGMDTGLWVLKRKDDGTFENELVDRNAGGFEHATHVADLDGDGKVEIYAASEKPGFRELRQYAWTDGAWKRTKIAPIPEKHITWNLQDGRF